MNNIKIIKSENNKNLKLHLFNSNIKYANQKVDMFILKYFLEINENIT